LRWRLTAAGVEKGAKTGSLTLTLRLRWRLIDAGVEKGAKNWLPHAGASMAMACHRRWRWKGAIQPPLILRHR
jgi:hypothetical protein